MPVRRFTLLPALLLVLLVCSDARASFHLWEVSELYSSADGQVQFIELYTTSPHEYFLTGVELISDDAGSSAQNIYTFTEDADFPTDDHHLLIATANVASLTSPTVTPDYEIPSSFLFTGGGTLTLTSPLDTAFVFNYGPLPSDNVSSLLANGSTATNSPTNFAGATGSVVVPEPASLALLSLSAGAVLVRRRSRA